MPNVVGDNWKNEHHQRGKILNILQSLSCNDDDIILISDVDEIINHKEIDNYTSFEPYYFNQKFFRYYLNCISSETWQAPYICRFKSIKDLGYLLGRSQHRVNTNNIIQNGGWHFSYCGGEDAIIYKLNSFSHTEPGVQCWKNKDKLTNAMKNLSPMFGNAKLKLLPIDNAFPKYIQDNESYFRQIGYIK